MLSIAGWTIFLAAPFVLAGFLLRLFPACRRFRWRTLLVYPLVMTPLIGGALVLVSWIAGGRIVWTEVLVVLWFAVGWRLAWELWSRSVGRWGERWRRWSRIRRRQRLPSPIWIRFIPAGRIFLTALLFAPLLLSMVLTHRFKIYDGRNPGELLCMRYETVQFETQDGFSLEGWFMPAEGATRTLLICHGAGANKGNFIWFLSPLSFKGYNLMMFDFRAHGSSGGRTCTYGLREKRDVRAAVDWLKEHRAGQSKKIVGLGSSQGAMALVLAAAEDERIDAIILDSPFVSPRALAHDHARRIPIIGPLATDWILLLMSIQTGTDFFADYALDAVDHLKGRPIFLIHGDEDIIMPAGHTRRLYERASGPREVWYGPGTHSNIITTVPDEYADRVFAFLDETIGRTTDLRLDVIQQNDGDGAE